jgi:hypothetical protein
MGGARWGSFDTFPRARRGSGNSTNATDRHTVHATVHTVHSIVHPFARRSRWPPAPSPFPQPNGRRKVVVDSTVHSVHNTVHGSSQHRPPPLDEPPPRGGLPPRVDRSPRARPRSPAGEHRGVGSARRCGGGGVAPRRGCERRRSHRRPPGAGGRPRVPLGARRWCAGGGEARSARPRRDERGDGRAACSRRGRAHRLRGG